jgi:hypothetical protein
MYVLLSLCIVYYLYLHFCIIYQQLLYIYMQHVNIIFKIPISIF